MDKINEFALPVSDYNHIVDIENNRNNLTDNLFNLLKECVKYLYRWSNFN